MSMPSSRLDVATMPRSRPVLQLLLDLQALLARQRAVVRADELLARELVEARREAFGEPAGVGEHDRGVVRADELEDARVHVRPDAAGSARVVEPEHAARSRPDAAECAPGSFMSSTGTITSRSSDLREPASTTVTGRGRRRTEAAEEARDLVERALGGREPDALRRRVGDRLEPFEREHQVRAALGRRERVDLVDDHGLARRAASRAPAT